MKVTVVTGPDQCTICQDSMPLSGGGYWVNQLFPTKHVRKLDGCDHYIHSACFQNYVNRELATNFDHRGSIPCPLCKKTTQGVQSTQDALKMGSHFDWGINILSGIFEVIAIGFLQTARNSKLGMIPSIMLGIAFIIGGIAPKIFYNKKCKENPAIILRLVIAYYNLYYGTSVERKDIAFGLTIERSMEEWLAAYCNLVPSIIVWATEKEIPSDDDLFYQVTFSTLSNELREKFIEVLKKAIEEKPEDLPPIFNDVKNHFWQIAFDKDKQGDLLGYLTRLAIEKKILILPKNYHAQEFDYNNIDYTTFHFLDED